MLPPGWLARPTTPVMVDAARTASTAVASGDSTDEAYVAKLHNLGFTWPWSSDADKTGWVSAAESTYYPG